MKLRWYFDRDNLNDFMGYKVSNKGGKILNTIKINAAGVTNKR